MSHIIKALNKAMHENSKISSAVEEKTEASVAPVLSENTRKSLTIDYHAIFLAILIGLVAIGIYLNYSVFQNLTVTQNRMAALTENLKSQQSQLDSMSKIMVQTDSDRDSQNKAFLSKIDKLSVSFDEQIDEVRNQSHDQHVELSKNLEIQQEKIEALTSQYDHVDKSLSNFTDVNNRYIEQLNLLKKKIAELKYREPQDTTVNN
ncbi:MAG: hypothetical protein JNN05_09000 [Candidatus Omnitrophica bacterium]|nr:hypothetical protein [Candidatus Omnitrophota bacterium]